MKQKLNRAVFFLAQIILITILLLHRPAVISADGEEPTATPSPTMTVEPTVTSETSEENSETKGDVPIYGGAPVYGGVPAYGGGLVEPGKGNVMLDKMVKNPATGNFVDQLGPLDPKYRPLNIVVFKITVKNPGEESVENAKVVDSLPEFVDYMSGPENSTYDSASRQLTFQIDSLGAGEEREIEIKARISHQSLLPEEKNVVCPVNLVEATLADNSDRDESQFCIEKELIVPQVPEAGAETLMLSIFGSLLSTGIYLRKKVSKL